MRIIAGQWRSRKILWPEMATTRPMPDRIRQAVFDRLGVYYEQPGSLPPLRVADVFAGSGSMGLEALSRGVASCCFFETERDVISILQQNIDTLKASSVSSVERRDAWSAVLARSAMTPFDLFFFDPPYAQSQDLSPAGQVGACLQAIPPHPTNNQLMVLHVKKGTAIESFEPWKIYDQRNYGTHVMLMLEREKVVSQSNEASRDNGE